MTSQQPLMSRTTAYRETVGGLLRLHRYTVEKQDQTTEYHDLCAALGDYWSQMTPVERERAGGLSQDLYTVSDLQRKEVEPNSTEEQIEFGTVYEARERGDWDFAFATLRKLEAVIPSPLVAYLRGSIWEAMDDKQVAMVFYEHAHRLDPENESIKAAFLNVLKLEAPIVMPRSSSP